MKLEQAIQSAKARTRDRDHLIDGASAGEFPRLSAWFKTQALDAGAAAMAIHDARANGVPDFSPDAGAEAGAHSSAAKPPADESIEAIAARIASY